MACCTGSQCKTWSKENALLLATLAGVIIGIGLGIGMREAEFSNLQIEYFVFPGELLLRMLKLMILPLIVCSLITGVSSLDQTSSGKMGLRAVVYYMTTTLIAVIIGIVLVVSIQPGRAGKEDLEETGSAPDVAAVDAMLDILRNIFPENIVQACFQQSTLVLAGTWHYKLVYSVIWTIVIALQLLVTAKKVDDAISIQNVHEFNKYIVNYQTYRVPIYDNITQRVTYQTTVASVTTMPTVTEIVETIVDYDIEGQYKLGINVLGIITFCITFGIIIGSQKDGALVIRFFSACNEAVMKMVMIVVWYSPIGIIFLIAGEIMKMDDPQTTLTQLGLYMATVIAGLAIHGIIVLPLIYFIIVRKNPFRYLLGVSQALMTALATSSSSATLPVTISNLEQKNNVDKRVTRFVVPIGATINMDGTALYEAVAAIFIAQLNGIYLNFGQIVTVSLTATLASIGAAGVPQAGLVTLVIVLSAVGLPTDDISLILAVDWLLDRIRTTVNVLGDSIGAGVLQRLSRKELKANSVKDQLDDWNEDSDYISNTIGYELKQDQNQVESGRQRQQNTRGTAPTYSSYGNDNMTFASDESITSL